MRKVVLYIAASLDGYIARPDGNVDWLQDPDYALEGEDYGYKEFYDSIETTLMGNKTYLEILGYDVPFPYPDKINYVFTRSDKEDNEHVNFINNNLAAFAKDLKNSSGKDIWLIGGGEINSQFLEHGLIDRIILTLMPITLGEGLPMFPAHSMETKFNITKSETFKSGLCQLTYDKRSIS